jgi:hypothetical protein
VRAASISAVSSIDPSSSHHTLSGLHLKSYRTVQLASPVQTASRERLMLASSSITHVMSEISKLATTMAAGWLNERNQTHSILTNISSC